MIMKKLLLLSILVLATATLQAATKYEINVGGVEVTSDNASNVTGGAITKLSSNGKVTYNATTKTLTLTDISISRSGSSDRAIHNRNCPGVKIVLAGNCNFSGSGCSTLYFQKLTYLNVTGNATVTCTSSGDDAIYCKFENSEELQISGSGSLKLISTKGEGIEGTNKSRLALVISHLTVNSARENFKNFTNISIYGNDNPGSKFYLAPTSSSSYPHISTATKIDWARGMTIKNAPSSVTVAALQYASEYSREFYLGNYKFDFSSFYGFTDTNFISYLNSRFPEGFVMNPDICTSIDVSNKGIYSLNGISNFDKLTSLNASGNKLTSIDIDKLTNLQSLNLSNNKFTTLNISSSWTLKSLNVANNTSLTNLVVNNNKILNTFNVDGCANLTELRFTNNVSTSLAPLSITGLSKLTYLSVSGCTYLTTLDCSNNQLSQLDIRNCKWLAYLHIYNNKLSKSGISDIISNLPLFDDDNKKTAITLYSYKSSERNVVDDSHILDIYNKKWKPYRIAFINNSDTSVLIEKPRTRGDLNDDGLINTADVSELYAAILRADKSYIYDINGDSEVNAADVSTLYELILAN